MNLTNQIIFLSFLTKRIDWRRKKGDEERERDKNKDKNRE